MPTYDDIVKAAQILDGITFKTPVLTSEILNKTLGSYMNNGQGGGEIEVYLKCEVF